LDTDILKKDVLLVRLHKKDNKMKKQTKKKSKFPDHSGDGKITKKDILMAKGIIPKKKKKGKK
jgi:hypothetical protein